MDKLPSKPMLMTFVLILLLAARADNGGPQAVDEPAVTNEPVPEPTATPEPTGTPQPTDTPEPTASPGSTATSEPAAAGGPPASFGATATALPAVATMEAILKPPEFVLGELATYTVESTGLTFEYPSGWVVAEDPDEGILVESKAGYSDRLATGDGAAIAILTMAAGDLPGQDSLEKLAAFIISKGMPESVQLGDPVTTTVNDQELTFSAFVDQSVGLEGVYAAFLAGEEVIVVFAVAGGESRTSYRPAVETVVNSIVLPQTE